MDCDTNVFSILRLNSTSYGNENFITTECISNWAKFGLFLPTIILWTVLLIWIVIVMFKEVMRTGRTWDLRKKVYTYFNSE